MPILFAADDGPLSGGLRPCRRGSSPSSGGGGGAAPRAGRFPRHREDIATRPGRAASSPATAAHVEALASSRSRWRACGARIARGNPRLFAEAGGAARPRRHHAREIVDAQRAARIRRRRACAAENATAADRARLAPPRQARRPSPTSTPSPERRSPFISRWPRPRKPRAGGAAHLAAARGLAEPQSHAPPRRWRVTSSTASRARRSDRARDAPRAG